MSITRCQLGHVIHAFFFFLKRQLKKKDMNIKYSQNNWVIINKTTLGCYNSQFERHNWVSLIRIHSFRGTITKSLRMITAGRSNIHWVRGISQNGRNAQRPSFSWGKSLLVKKTSSHFRVDWHSFLPPKNLAFISELVGTHLLHLL